MDKKIEKWARAAAAIVTVLALFVCIGCGGGSGASGLVDDGASFEEVRPVDRLLEWVGADDGILVCDSNLDGEVQQEELFGNTALTGRTNAGGDNAIEDLALWDYNGDGVLSSLDATFWLFRVWKDSNGNGKADEGELLTLEKARVSQISLGYGPIGATTAAGWYVTTWPSQQLLFASVPLRSAGSKTYEVLILDLDGDGIETRNDIAEGTGFAILRSY